jgi:hypothetical protein
VLKNFVAAQALNAFFVASPMVNRGENEGEGLPIFGAIPFDPTLPLPLPIRARRPDAASRTFQVCDGKSRK